MHPRNCFITLTYSDENLKSPKLDYTDFQKFMKRLRKTQNEPIGMFVTGEYGDQNKRPHWHAIIFNWQPSDATPKYKTKRGDQVWESETLSKIWGLGLAEFGSVTLDSAGYCARYAAKKIVHTPNNKIAEADHHEWQPISKKSSKHAIGKKWLEQFWPDVFLNGRMVIKKDGTESSIPRYYEKWFRENHPDAWFTYVTTVKQKKCEEARTRVEREQKEWWASFRQRAPWKKNPLTRDQIRALIKQQKFNQLQDYLKL